MNLTEVCTPRGANASYTLDVPPGWGINRGTFGGLVIGSLVRAIEAELADPTRRVRTLTAEVPAAVVAGPAAIAVAPLRRGNNIAVLRAELQQGGEARAHAVAIAAPVRRGAGPLAWQDVRPPEAPPWHDVPVTPTARFPEFTQQFEYRFVEGVPFTGGGDARAVGWIRPRDPGPARDTAYIAAMIDAWWPAAMIRMPAPRPLATIAFTLDIVAGVDGLDPEAPLLYRGTVPVCADGYFLETRELWGEDGRLVARNHQTFAVIA
jgi:acyl-CoA thioesterase